jgi:hypothetical protein
MRDPAQISNSIGRSHEFLLECVGDYYESGFYYKYFNETPQDVKYYLKDFLINFLKNKYYFPT